MFIHIQFLTSYFASAVFAVVAIVLAYITDSLPLWYLTSLDRRLITHTRNKLPFFSPWIEATSRDKRVDGFARFAWALSDQQLVTGLALLISAFINTIQATNFEFGIIVALAWFSSTTHLATLNMLKDYFVQRRVIRKYRIAGMIMILISLSFAFISSTFPMLAYSGLTFQCLFCMPSNGGVLCQSSSYP